MALQIDTQIQFLKGVGPKLGELFSRNGINTIRDLIEFVPRAYEDRRVARSIMTLKPNETVSLKAQFVKVSSIAMGKSSRRMYDVTLQDSSGQIHCKYFRVPFRGYFDRFEPWQEVRVIGKVTEYRGRIEFHHPDIRVISEEDDALEDTLVPIYVEIEGLSSVKIYRLVQLAINQINAETWPDSMPESLRKKMNLMGRFEALKKLHKPDLKDAQALLDRKSQSHYRLIFEEFFWLEFLLASKKQGLKLDPGPQMTGSGKLAEKLLANLPFELTGDQKKSFQEIKQDLFAKHPMHRLLQGDVGSGKTLVSFLSALVAIESGFQTVLMAPTEILAEQHFKTAAKFLESLGVRTALMVGSLKNSQRNEILQKLADQEIDLLIGTHALLEPDVKLKNLGLVIIDEQHRFGVSQRGILKQKGTNPHFLVMTATPIPRTLALTVYGDLEVSIIRELPPGRSPIQTRVVFESKKSQVLDFLKKQIEAGRQAYVVYPLVEESEKLDLKNAHDEFEKISQLLPGIQVGLLHGRMKAAEKDEIMDRFRENKIQVLVSTTVIEVGVDVPNASMMIVENAERFGLSQLHQLRGRVGRGTTKSFCVLIMGYAVSEEAKARTQFMEQTNDGFKIAEFDLEMRGPGEFLGIKQSGLPGFKFANILKDTEILETARAAAFAIIDHDPHLKSAENRELTAEMKRSQSFHELLSIG